MQGEPTKVGVRTGGTERLAIRVGTEAGKTMTTIRVEGELTSDDMPEVRAACESAKPPFRLDLSGLRVADRSYDPKLWIGGLSPGATP